MKNTKILISVLLTFVFLAEAIFAADTTINVESPNENLDALGNAEKVADLAGSVISTQIRDEKNELANIDAIRAKKSNRVEIVNQQRKNLEKILGKNNPKNNPTEKTKPTMTLPKKKVKDIINNRAKTGRLNKTNFPKVSRNVEANNFAGNKLTVAQVRKMFFPGVAFKDLTSKQRKTVLANYNWLLKNKVTLAFLIAITRAEGSPGPKTVVGYVKNGGYRYKSADCQKRIAKLDLSKHAKEQGLPQGCFVTTSAGKSSAFGYFQVVNSTNKTLKSLGFTNFSRKTQARYALELVRRNRKTIKGFIALVQGGNNDRRKLDVGIKKGTVEWASGYSPLPGRKAPILDYARQELKKLQDPKPLKQFAGKSYYQAWLDEFSNDSIK